MLHAPKPITLPWTQGYADLGTPFSHPQAPAPLPDLHWVACNDVLRAELGLADDWWAQERVLPALGGNAALPGSTPQATVYSGHQFGVWAGQLGDGRALSLGTLQTPVGPRELQLKGAGRTPYSRMGDGRAVLRSSIREYLASEALWGLGIPTTRALCVVGSPAAVRREVVETAAVVTRVSPSFVRFGHFEHFAQTHNHDDGREALHTLVAHLAPLLGAAPEPLAVLRAIVDRTARLIAQWQGVGFCHGVMNTDNMSALGLTLDYGPFQFMDGFDAHHVCNHSDHTGRYAYSRQPQVAYWNLFCLGQALLPLVGEPQEVVQVLETYKATFTDALHTATQRKLGLSMSTDGDAALQQDLLKLLQREHTDWTVFWRRLSHAVAESGTSAHAFEPVQDLIIDRAAWYAWLSRYQQRLDHEASQRQTTPNEMGQAMLRTNPKFVLRNYLAELAIADAKEGRFDMVADLMTVLHRPFDEHPAHEAWAQVAPEWASRIEVSCSS
jgi:uncharacterized protein YdiU (UPF0061 family)